MFVSSSFSIVYIRDKKKICFIVIGEKGLKWNSLIGVLQLVGNDVEIIPGKTILLDFFFGGGLIFE